MAPQEAEGVVPRRQLPCPKSGHVALRKLSTRERSGSDRGFHGNYDPGAFLVKGGTTTAATMSAAMDKSIVKVHLPSGGFNVLKCGDATDIKVRGGRGMVCGWIVEIEFL